MTKKEERLKRVNNIIQRISNESNSVLLKNMPEMFYNKDIPGSPFNGDVYCRSWFQVDEREVAMNEDNQHLQNLVRVRIEGAVYGMIDLLEKELELLKKGR